LSPRLLSLVAGFSLGLLPLAGAGATPVVVAAPTVGPATQTLSLSGNLTPQQAAAISPQVAGVVAAMRVDAGDAVAAGDVLVELDARTARLEQARARAVVEEARTALAEAERLRDEGRRLLERRVLPESEVQAREAALRLAAAAVDRARSELDLASERVAQHVIRAPFGGVVSRRLADAGEWVGTGSPVVELVTVDDLWLDVRVPQQFWSRLGPDLQLAAYADALPGQQLDAQLHARVPVNDPAARTFLLRLRVHDESGRLIPGMSARVELELSGDGAVTSVPRDAITRYPDGSATVWVIMAADGGWVAHEHQVRLLRLAGERAELAGELPAGAGVVIRGNEGLAEGERVTIAEAP
jgi:RND family efflux transporter MFP subunit